MRGDPPLVVELVLGLLATGFLGIACVSLSAMVDEWRDGETALSAVFGFGVLLFISCAAVVVYGLATGFR